MKTNSSFPIWTVYFLCLAVGIAAMGWLGSETAKLERFRQLDRAEVEQARREAELQERVSSALWKMDTMLTPLMAQEATRAISAYQSFQSSPGTKFSTLVPDVQESSQLKGLEGWTASPLLTPPNEFVRLHFQIDAQGQYSSPQVPQGIQREQALACGVSAQAVDENQMRLQQLASFCSYDQALENCLLERVPAEVLPLEPWQQGQALNDFVKKNIDTNRVFGQNPRQQTAADLESTFESIPDASFAPSPDSNSVPDVEAEQAEQSVVAAQRSRIQLRETQELDNRGKAAQNYALNALADSLIRNAPAEAVETGVMRPFWLGNHLLLARRVERSDQTLVQGCWLNWESLAAHLRQEVADVLPDVQLRAVALQPDGLPPTGRILATLPVELVVNQQLSANLGFGESPLGSAGWSSSQLAIAAGWIGLFAAAIASAVLLNGLLRLSARRAAFVSAVSHELRSPLTTFQLYSEMLADGLVDEPQRDLYAQTLKSESVRLAGLVENVLQYARLDRSRSLSKLQGISIGDLLERVWPRLQARADQNSWRLELKIPPAARAAMIKVDLAGVERVLFNLIDNACKYAQPAQVPRIVVEVGLSRRRVVFSVQDFGPGVPKRKRSHLFAPFSKSDQEAADSSPGVGLGLALCQRLAREMKGRVRWISSPVGARFALELPRQESNILENV